jgi:hypothetical protein
VAVMTGTLDYNAIEESIESFLRDLLASFSSRYGYDPGANCYELAHSGEDAVVLRSCFGGENLPAGILPFFNHFSRFSFPDIGNGYFIGPPSWVVAIYENAEPRQVSDGHVRQDLISIGSDGGGKIFAARVQGLCGIRPPPREDP